MLSSIPRNPCVDSCDWYKSVMSLTIGLHKYSCPFMNNTCAIFFLDCLSEFWFWYIKYLSCTSRSYLYASWYIAYVHFCNEHRFFLPVTSQCNLKNEYYCSISLTIHMNCYFHIQNLHLYTPTRHHHIQDSHQSNHIRDDHTQLHDLMLHMVSFNYWHVWTCNF